jgi:hypothetical protein
MLRCKTVKNRLVQILGNCFYFTSSIKFRTIGRWKISKVAGASRQ